MLVLSGMGTGGVHAECNITFPPHHRDLPPSPKRGNQTTLRRQDPVLVQLDPRRHVGSMAVITGMFLTRDEASIPPPWPENNDFHVDFFAIHWG